ncbi:MAG: FGGY-family carbohydrate kinase, partial [Acidobacteriaceae bacterium]|nr:FGGY-family carbohydrate kinase [Acidobacteriaceae bacterium]
YRDNRTEGMMERVASRLSAADIYRITGIQFQPFNTLYQLAAMAEQELEWTAQARHLLMIPDYLHYALSGVLSNEYTEATTTQMLGLNGRWHEGLFQAAGIPEIWMQPPVDAGTEVGQMQLGSAAVKVIAPASHDTASAVAGTPLEGPGEAFLSSGTWSLLGIESEVPIVSELAMRWNFTNEGGYGRRYRVLKNIMGLWLLQRLSQEFEVVIDDALLNRAAGAKSWRSIVNPNDARFMNPVSMSGAIREYCRKTQQPEPDTLPAYVRCVLESLALSYAVVTEQIEALSGRQLTMIHIVGGGSRNRLLNQLCADSCQLSISSGPVEASALGNLCAQMITLGEIGSLDEARKLIRQSFVPETFQPLTTVPREVTDRFRQYLECSSTLYKS